MLQSTLETFELVDWKNTKIDVFAFKLLIKCRQDGGHFRRSKVNETSIMVVDLTWWSVHEALQRSHKKKYFCGKMWKLPEK